MVIKGENARIEKLVLKAIELKNKEEQYRRPWIIFDRDRVVDFDSIILSAERNDVGIGWSIPCIEIWLHAHLGEIPVSTESTQCCKRFEDKFQKVTKKEYRKNDKDIYKKMTE